MQFVSYRLAKDRINCNRSTSDECVTRDFSLYVLLVTRKYEHIFAKNIRGVFGFYEVNQTFRKPNFIPSTFTT